MSESASNSGDSATLVEAGTVLGDFRIEQFLAAGAMGAVYVAEQISLSRRVAVKIFSPALTPEPESRAQFLREMKMTAALDHPNIATAYGAGEADDLVYLAMKYVDGRDLGELLAEYPRIDERDALDVVEGIAKALAYAWDQHRLIHRDIKPSNIKLDQRAVPHLLDLGIAVSAQHVCELDEAGIVLGTPHYMSPEQASGTGDMDFRTDVYSLGATLYHMITGQTTQAEGPPTEVLTAVLRNDVTPPIELNPKVSEAVNALVMRMLATAPEDRQDSWGGVIAEIEQARAMRESAGTTRRIRRSTGGLKQPAAAGAASASSATGTVGGKRRRLPPAVVGCVVAALVTGGAFWVMTAGGKETQAKEEVTPRPPTPLVQKPEPIEATAPINRVPALMAKGRGTPALVDSLRRELQQLHDQPASPDEKTAAGKALAQLREETKAATKEIENLQRRWVAMAAAGKGTAAMAAMRSYDGPYGGWLAARRDELRAAIEGGMRQYEKGEAQKLREIGKQRQRAASAVAAVDFEGARACSAKMRQLGASAEMLAELDPWTMVDLNLAATFRDEVGKMVFVQLSDGTHAELKVLGVDGPVIRMGREDPALGVVEREFTYRGLAFAFCEQRLGRLPEGRTQALILGLGHKEKRQASLNALQSHRDAFIKEIVANVKQ